MVFRWCYQPQDKCLLASNTTKQSDDEEEILDEQDKESESRTLIQSQQDPTKISKSSSSSSDASAIVQRNKCGVFVRNRSLLDDDDDAEEEGSERTLIVDTGSLSDNSLCANNNDPSTKLFKLSNKHIQKIGSQIKKSKLQVTWSFQQGEGFDITLYFVTLTWSKLSGKILIHMNGEQVFASKAKRTSSGPYFAHEWKTEDGMLNMQILTSSRKITSMLFLKNHDLIVNGKSFVNLPELSSDNNYHKAKKV